MFCRCFKWTEKKRQTTGQKQSTKGADHAHQVTLAEHLEKHARKVKLRKMLNYCRSRHCVVRNLWIVFTWIKSLCASPYVFVGYFAWLFVPCLVSYSLLGYLCIPLRTETYNFDKAPQEKRKNNRAIDSNNEQLVHLIFWINHSYIMYLSLSFTHKYKSAYSFDSEKCSYTVF